MSITANMLDLSEQELSDLIKTMTDSEMDTLFAKIEKLDGAKKENPLLFFEPAPGGQSDFNNTLKRIAFMFGGNSSGKTYESMKKIVCFILGEDPSGTTPEMEYPSPPTRGWLGAIKHEKAWAMVTQTLLPLLPNGIIDHTDKRLNMIFFKNGSWLGLKSYNSSVDTWGSEALNYVALDEQPPYSHFVEAQSRVNRLEGYIWCAMTPEKIRHPWVYHVIYKNESGNPEIVWFTADMDDNIYLTDGAKTMFWNSYGGTSQEDSKIHGRFSVLQGLVHQPFSRETHIIQDFDTRYYEGYEHARVIDFHQAKPVVCNWFMFKKHPVPCVYVTDELIVNGHIRSIGEHIVAKSKGLPIKFSILDTPEQKDTVKFGTNSTVELAKIGIPTISSYQFRDMFSGIDRTNDYFASNKLFIFESCRKTISSVSSLMWKPWSNIEAEEDARERILKKNEDPARNIHMFLKTMPNTVVSVDNESVDNNNEFGYDSYLERGVLTGGMHQF